MVRISSRRPLVVLVALCLLVAGSFVLGTSRAAGQPPAQQSGPATIPASFFGMTALNGRDYPAVSIGALGKPGEWGMAWTEPERGRFRWSTIDADLTAAEAHGVDYFFDLGGTPPWAVRDQSSCSLHGIMVCTAPPDNIQDWDDYVTALVSRYQGRIAYYEIWNEPNITRFWSGSYTQMVQLAQSAYTIIKAIDPSAQVLTPAPTGPVHPAPDYSTTATDWMAAYLHAGGAQYADVGAWHGYIGRNGSPAFAHGATPFPMPEQDMTPGCAPEDCFGSILSKSHAMRAVFDANGMAGRPMFDTEGSWGIGTNLDPALQPQWLARWYLLQASSYATDDLQRVYWFAWGGALDGQYWGELQDGSGALTTAGIAMNQVYSWLVGSTFTSPCAAGANGVWSCELTLADGRQAMAVWAAASATSFTPPAGATRYWDIAGNSTPVGGAIVVDGNPILVVS